jgi:glycosyltransferase involved in cell wall biosynthesis
VKQALIANEGIPAERIRVIYNGAQLDDFAIDSQLRSQVRRELGIEDQVSVVIQVARLDYLKAHCTAVRTAQKVREAIGDFRLLLVGEGPERPKIEAEIERLGLGDTVRLLGLRTDVKRLLSAADVFLLTSISEGIPVTLIEAMGAELPVVSTAAGGVGEVVEHGRTGLVVPVGDEEALAAALIRFLPNADLRQVFGKQGRQRAQERFTESAMHAQYAALYDEMTGAGLARRSTGQLSASATYELSNA